MNFDNHVISITGRTEEDFKKALSFFFRKDTDKVNSYTYTVKHGLILFQDGTDIGLDATVLPYPMDYNAATDFAWNWWKQARVEEKEPDHDGNNEKGWRIYNEAWTHINGRWEALVAIKPIWAMYGK